MVNRHGGANKGHTQIDSSPAPRTNDPTASAYTPISVASNIAEGAERPDREFRRFLTIALGSNAEVEAQATIAADLGCIDQVTAATITDKTDHIGRMITNLIRHMPPSG